MFEQIINKSSLNNNRESSVIDKLLARDDVDKIKEIMQKPKMERQDMLSLLYLLSSTEAKLVNLGEWERYVLLKYFIWVREFVRQCEYLFDYEDNLKKKEVLITDTARKLLDNNRRLLEHNVKFLADLFLMISRSSMSIGAAGFKELLTNKFEMFYDQKANISTIEGIKRGGRQ